MGTAWGSTEEVDQRRVHVKGKCACNWPPIGEPSESAETPLHNPFGKDSLKVESRQAPTCKHGQRHRHQAGRRVGRAQRARHRHPGRRRVARHHLDGALQQRRACGEVGGVGGGRMDVRPALNMRSSCKASASKPAHVERGMHTVLAILPSCLWPHPPSRPSAACASAALLYCR